MGGCTPPHRRPTHTQRAHRERPRRRRRRWRPQSWLRWRQPPWQPRWGPGGGGGGGGGGGDGRRGGRDRERLPRNPSWGADAARGAAVGAPADGSLKKRAAAAGRGRHPGGRQRRPCVADPAAGRPRPPLPRGARAPVPPPRARRRSIGLGAVGGPGTHDTRPHVWPVPGPVHWVDGDDAAAPVLLPNDGRASRGRPTGRRGVPPAVGRGHRSGRRQPHATRCRRCKGPVPRVPGHPPPMRQQRIQWGSDTVRARVLAGVSTSSASLGGRGSGGSAPRAHDSRPRTPWSSRFVARGSRDYCPVRTVHGKAERNFSNHSNLKGRRCAPCRCVPLKVRAGIDPARSPTTIRHASTTSVIASVAPLEEQGRGELPSSSAAGGTAAARGGRLSSGLCVGEGDGVHVARITPRAQRIHKGGCLLALSLSHPHIPGPPGASICTRLLASARTTRPPMGAPARSAHARRLAPRCSPHSASPRGALAGGGVSSPGPRPSAAHAARQSVRRLTGGGHPPIWPPRRARS